MFKRRTKQDPNKQRPDKWSSTVLCQKTSLHMLSVVSRDFCAISHKHLENSSFIFYISLTAHFGTVLVNNQHDALFQCIYLFYLSTCFEQPSAHHQENQLYQYIIWYVSLCVSDRLIIPDDVLIQFDLLMMSTVMLETCREVNK
jgi:hypothetical protein